MRQWTQANRDHVKKYRDATRDRRNARRRELYALEEERRTRARADAGAWQRANPEKRKAQRLRKFGLTLAEFQALMEAQGGACAICGHSDTSQPNIFPLVDHCHATGKVRGLLCLNCNQALGKFKDDPVRLLAAVRYLNESNGSSGVGSMPSKMP